MTDLPDSLDFREYLTTPQIGELLGITLVRVQEWITFGIKTRTGRVHLAAVKIGSRWRAHPAVVAEFAKLPEVVAAVEAWKVGVAKRNAEREANRRAGQ